MKIAIILGLLAVLVVAYLATGCSPFAEVCK